ncbi:transporter substrate-binding domain-containing protein (plasmid) [Ensifer adhaerens]
MKNIIVFTFAGLLVGATSSQAAALKVAADCTYPPFGYQDANGEIKGFDVDVARAIGRQIGSEVEIICQAWDGMIPGLLAGKYDLISASMSITEERLQEHQFLRSLPLVGRPVRRTKDLGCQAGDECRRAEPGRRCR